MYFSMNIVKKRNEVKKIRYTNEEKTYVIQKNFACKNAICIVFVCFGTTCYTVYTHSSWKRRAIVWVSFYLLCFVSFLTVVHCFAYICMCMRLCSVIASANIDRSFGRQWQFELREQKHCIFEHPFSKTLILISCSRSLLLSLSRKRSKR